MFSIIRELGLSHNVNFIRVSIQAARANPVCEKGLMELHPGPAAFVIDCGGNFIGTRPRRERLCTSALQIYGIAGFSSARNEQRTALGERHRSENLNLIHY
jgi:hypothetical protein